MQNFARMVRLFMTDFSGEIVAYDPKTGKSETIVNSYNGKPLNGLNDLVFDESGGLYFTEPMGSSATHPVGRVFYLPANSKSPNCLQKILLIQMELLFPQTVNVFIFLNLTK